ncbi:unnamed protein product [Diamesa hyperborea]
MLKWSVKKRLDGQHEIYQLSDDEDESINRLYKPRRSLGNVLSEHSPNVSPVIDQKNNKRRSLGSRLINNRMRFDKENQVLSSPIENQLSNSINSRITSTPLNCKKLKRDQMLFKPPTSPIVVNKPCIYAPTLPPIEIEYSPVVKQPRYHPIVSCEIITSTPLIKRSSKLGDYVPMDHTNSLNSSDVGDVTLEKMIDAILASAKNGKKFKKTIKTKPTNNNFMKTLNEVCEQSMEQKNIKSLLNHDQTIIIIDNTLENVNEREVKSPIKNCDSINEEVEMEEKCLLKRQKGVRRKNNSNENKLKKKTGDETDNLDRDRDIQSCSTQKCLSFSSVNDVDLSEKSKRSSVASNSSTSLNSLTSISKYTKNLLVKGSLEMTITTDESQKKIIVHVIKCKNLFRISETHQINAYVKCALVSENPLPIQRNIFQRTAVHKNSTSPVFDHKFTFHMNNPGDYSKHIQLAVWHRNKELK